MCGAADTREIMQRSPLPGACNIPIFVQRRFHKLGYFLTGLSRSNYCFEACFVFFAEFPFADRFEDEFDFSLRDFRFSATTVTFRIKTGIIT